MKKGIWSAWDLNPGPHDGRRKRHHGTIAADQAVGGFLSYDISEVFIRNYGLLHGPIVVSYLDQGAF